MLRFPSTRLVVSSTTRAATASTILFQQTRTIRNVVHPLTLLRRHNDKVQQSHAQSADASVKKMSTTSSGGGVSGGGGLLSVPGGSASLTTSSSAAGTQLPLFSSALQCSCCGYGTSNEAGDGSGPHHHGHNEVEEENLAREVATFVGARLVQSLQREQPPRGSGIKPLLDYNKQWAAEVARLNPEYFTELAKQQTPQYLWIGCSDSRVPANEIVGLYPGDVFVHRNVANIVCNSDLNALAVIQYAVDCLKVEHVIVAGHYKCGGVTAALNEDRVGLADHWILHVSAVKKRHWRRIQSDIPTNNHLDALCELNVLAQVEHIVETHLIQRVWTRQNAEDALAKKEGRPTRNRPENEVEIHGWVYGLSDGVIRPLLSLNRRSNIEKELADAIEAVFWRQGQL